MNDPTLHLETLAVLIDRLIEEKDPRVQERILLEEICHQAWAQSASFLRETYGVNGGWIQVLARGPEDCLPTLEQVSAIDNGTLTADLPLGTRALFGNDGTGRVVLGLGGCGEGTTEDLLGSLLDVFCRFSVQSSTSVWGDVDLLDLLQPPVSEHHTPSPADEEES